MADKSIADLPVSGSMTDDALLALYQNGTTNSITGALIKSYAQNAVASQVTAAQTAAEEAEQSATQAETARQGAAAAQTAAESAQDAAETARDQSVAAAGTIGDSVEQAQTAAGQASSAKDAAVSAKTAAEAAKTAAETASGQAQTAATQASESATAAQTAATQAGDAKTDAETARNEAEASASSAANSASDAESAATEAEQAKTYIENMDMEGETLPAGSSVTVTKTTSPEGNLLFVIGVPQGTQGDKGDAGETGATGPQGVSVTNATVNEDGDLVITLSSGSPINAGSVIGPQGIQGEVGPTGASVDRIERTSGTGAPGTTDTYTVYLTDGQTGGTFQVYNGSNGAGAGDFMADGSVPMTGDLQMGGHAVTGMADGTDPTDGATVGQLAGKLDSPDGGTAGQVLTKTADGSAWENAPSGLPDGGVEGQMLYKSADGAAWGDKPVMVVNVTEGGDGTYTADKTYAEIMDAINAEVIVIAKESASDTSAYSFYALMSYNDEVIAFGYSTDTEGHQYIIKSDSSVQVVEYSYGLTTHGGTMDEYSEIETVPDDSGNKTTLSFYENRINISTNSGDTAGIDVTGSTFKGENFSFVYVRGKYVTIGGEWWYGNYTHSEAIRIEEVTPGDVDTGQKPVYSTKIHFLADPTDPQDATNKQYVDTQLSTKLTTPTGTAGQLLGFTADNTVGAVDAPDPLPSGGTTGQMLYQGDSGPEWGDKPVMYVNITGSDGNYQADKTVQEIREAFESGFAVYAVMGGTSLVPLYLSQTDSAIFLLFANGKDIMISLSDAGNPKVSTSDLGANDILFTPTSTLTSENVQDAIEEVDTQLSTKLTTPTGTQGQLLGFTADNTVGAVDAPESGLTQEQADERYLQLTGGTLTGDISIGSGSGRIFLLGSETFVSSGGGTDIGIRLMMLDDGTYMNLGTVNGTRISMSPDSREGYGNITIDSHYTTIKGLISPSASNDAANKAYVDSKSPTSVAITLTTSGWSSNTQTVTVSGVSASETAQLITPTPAIASQSAYYEAGIMCTGQATNSLTFTCQTVPTSNLTVYVVIQPLS